MNANTQTEISDNDQAAANEIKVGPNMQRGIRSINNILVQVATHKRDVGLTFFVDVKAGEIIDGGLNVEMRERVV